jgi:hypothetical protein
VIFIVYVPIILPPAPIITIGPGITIEGGVTIV